MQLNHLFIVWAVSVLVVGVAFGVSERKGIIKSSAVRRLVHVAVALVWSAPLFVYFVHWAAAGTPLAFGPPLRSRGGPSSSAFFALLSLASGVFLVWYFAAFLPRQPLRSGPR
jgi:hypothetical protein